MFWPRKSTLSKRDTKTRQTVPLILGTFSERRSSRAAAEALVRSVVSSRLEIWDSNVCTDAQNRCTEQAFQGPNTISFHSMRDHQWVDTWNSMFSAVGCPLRGAAVEGKIRKGLQVHKTSCRYILYASDNLKLHSVQYSTNTIRYIR
jgi:hypothetical protein